LFWVVFSNSYEEHFLPFKKIISSRPHLRGQHNYICHALISCS
jgi:hypothetical protein